MLTIRQWVWKFLGLDELVCTVRQIDGGRASGGWQSGISSTRAEEMHAEAMAAINALTEQLQRIHAFEKPKPFTPDMYSWEQVQQMAAAEAQKED